MAKWRKKPVVVEAFRMGIDPRPDWFQDEVTRDNIRTHVVDPEHMILGNDPFKFTKTYCVIKTREGEMVGDYGDYIIQEPFPSADRKIYPCKPDIFRMTYEPADKKDCTHCEHVYGTTTECDKCINDADL